MGMYDDLNDFKHSIVVGASWADLSVSETADLKDQYTQK